MNTNLLFSMTSNLGHNVAQAQFFKVKNELNHSYLFSVKIVRLGEQPLLVLFFQFLKKQTRNGFRPLSAM